MPDQQTTDEQTSDAMLPALWRDSIFGPREVPGRGLCGVQRFIFTCGLLTGLTFDGYTYNYTARYCYESTAEALVALMTWNGQGDPGGEWIKEKVSERAGPGRAG
jgi:hypothetical protein